MLLDVLPVLFCLFDGDGFPLTRRRIHLSLLTLSLSFVSLSVRVGSTRGACLRLLHGQSVSQTWGFKRRGFPDVDSSVPIVVLVLFLGLSRFFRDFPDFVRGFPSFLA